MIKKLSIYIGLLALLALLASCSAQNSMVDPMSVEEVVEVLTEQGFILEKNEDLSIKSVFAQELNGVTPEVYLLEGNMLSLYVFPTSKERAEGIVEFGEKTATMNLIDHQIYGINNILVFYVSADEKLQEDLFEALILLDNPE
ncbi:hypothetical protein [Bacillus sp. RO1]|uniref:hypothetical protein n=1 Tax=Bacillus sp. RO1 TaxID=2722703 RepID=UPI00197B8CEA|nr:hypothetical protein [Bacillus sp. RO1]